MSTNLKTTPLVIAWHGSPQQNRPLGSASVLHHTSLLLYTAVCRIVAGAPMGQGLNPKCSTSYLVIPMPTFAHAYMPAEEAMSLTENVVQDCGRRACCAGVMSLVRRQV